ncbi:MAG: phytanoyl-CoA dioxygenase family protein [Acidobacteriota bacterium]|nr:phytanoyl-CoA dioxygenase family protein [Acidobacteriota bacterium]
MLKVHPLCAIMDGFELSAGASDELDGAGFTIVPGPVPTGDLAQLAAAYDTAVGSAAPDDVKVASSTTRVSDFVNRGPEFDGLYLHPPVLKACCRIINEPFRLSTMHARTLRPRLPAQNLHVDFERDSRGWTMVGFIFMVDEFRNDNGATRFVPGSHLWSTVPPTLLGGLKTEYPGQILACGPAGSMIVFNGSVWHGHTVNRSDEARRSIQGAYIRREAGSGANLPARMLPDTLSRISPLAKYLLAVEPLES